MNQEEIAGPDPEHHVLVGPRITDGPVKCRDVHGPEAERVKKIIWHYIIRDQSDGIFW